MKVLNIIEIAYRATLEEQDDPVVWIIHAMKGAGADHSVLLSGNAVNYAVTAQGVPPLMFGDRAQKHAPRLAEQVAGLVAKGVDVMVVRECLTERGIREEELIGGLTMVKQAAVPKMMGGFDQVWHW
ncbi:DsrE family protein [Dongia deserti]|uniref:DsrE family protein n=1 Tax=Dongia deserti TaxID=2268030 RepID=UPI000E6490A2|nr:DsrE family protein [Dongia deserti]